MIEIANDRNGRVRKDAVKALCWTDGPELQRLLQHGLSDPNSKVRRWATRGLETITEIKPLMDT